MRLGLFLIVVLACSGAAAAEDVREQQARAELDRELEAMMKVPQPWVEVSFEGINSTRYELLEGSFELDGVLLPFKPAEGKGGAGQALFSGQISPGRHTVTTTLVYREQAGTFVFNYTGIKFKLPGRFSFDAPRGLRLRMPIRVEVDENATDLKKRLQVLASLEADLMMEVEEGAPPAVAEPVLPRRDAGTAQEVEGAGQKAAGAGPPAGMEPSAPVVQSSGPADAGTALAKGTRPKRKRIKRHMKNLLQNLAKSSKEDAAAQASQWTQVVDEEVPAGEGAASGTRPPVIPHSLRAALREDAEPSGAADSGKSNASSEDPVPLPRGGKPTKSTKSSKSSKGSKHSKARPKAARDDSAGTSP